MTDLHTRFRTLDTLSAPNLWYDIEERAMAIQPTPRRSSWVLIVVTLLLALVVGGAVLVGSGIVKLPISVDASATPSSTAQASSTAVSSASSTQVEQRTASWTATGIMIEVRGRPTVTLLLDGRVLAAGGYSSTGDGAPLASAERYDPGSGVWTPTGNMIEARHGHTATLLLDGKVLVVGGYDSVSGTVASAELYDPGSGTWTPTGNMVESRDSHTATLLPDGTVLVAGGNSISLTGGSGVGSTVTSAELYDPGSGSWAPTGNMIDDRAGHTATLLSDGRVLVTGGISTGISIPGGAEPVPVASAELYDPSSGSWTTTASMIEVRADPTVTLLLDGSVLVAGGSDSSGGPLASAELYDPGSGSWTPTGNMIEARYGDTATLLPDGKVLVAGGIDSSSGNLASAELYDPGSGSWTTTASMIEVRSGTATLLLNGKVLLAGDTTSGGPAVELYDPGSGS